MFVVVKLLYSQTPLMFMSFFPSLEIVELIVQIKWVFVNGVTYRFRFTFLPTNIFLSWDYLLKNDSFLSYLGTSNQFLLEHSLTENQQTSISMQ